MTLCLLLADEREQLEADNFRVFTKGNAYIHRTAAAVVCIACSHIVTASGSACVFNEDTVHMCHTVITKGTECTQFNYFTISYKHIRYLDIFLVWCFLVSFKSGRLREVFSTLITSIGFLSGMNSPVWFKVCQLREVLSTMLTSIGFLSCMSSLVFFKAAHVREVLSTLITSIGFLSSVNSLVYFKSCRCREAFTTLITAVAFLLSQTSLLIHLW